MLRIALLISLLASLIFMFRQFSPEPWPEPQVAQDRTDSRPVPMPGIETGLEQKPVPLVVPEVYDGYLFVEERRLEEADLADGGQDFAEETSVALEQVFYSGSLIIGEKRQALVTYQQNNTGGRRPGLSLDRGRAAAAEAQSGYQNKVLKPGDRFMGYEVAAIEPEKIVFKKGGEKVEKFLFDQNKKRPVVNEPPRPAPAPAPANGQTGVNAPPVVTPPFNLPPNVRIAPVGDASSQPSATRRSRRSQRLLGTNPPPAVPAQPVPPAQPAPQSN
jgi:hypothetical protein